MESNSGEVLFDIRHVSHTFETEEGKTFDALKDVTAQIKKRGIYRHHRNKRQW